MAHPLSAPTEASLRDAAVRHLARYSTTVAGLTRVLDRRIERWAREAAPDGAEKAALRQIARDVAQQLARAGAVDDRLFAASRTRSLANTGRSRRAIAAHLAARGTDALVAREALPDAETDLVAALITARRRRFGPWRTGAGDLLARRRELGGLARAGFSQPVARAALELPRDEAEALIAARRQGS